MHAVSNHPLAALLRQRIVILDGAMGTMVQQHKLSEEQFRGERFAKHPAKSLKGDLELLQLTRPDVIEEIHTQYLEAGADVIETNTFSATTIGQHDFLFAGNRKAAARMTTFFERVIDDPELVALAHEMNVAAAESRAARPIESRTKPARRVLSPARLVPSPSPVRFRRM